MNSEQAGLLNNILDTFNLIGDELTNQARILEEFEVLEMQMNAPDSGEETKEEESENRIAELERSLLAKAPQTYAYILSDRIKPLIAERIMKIKTFYKSRSGVVSTVSSVGKAAYIGAKIGQAIKEGSVVAARGREAVRLESVKGVAATTAGKVLMSKSTWIAAAAFATVEVGLSYYDFRKGNIDWKEFKRSLKYIAGETVASVGGGALGSSIGAAIGMAFGPLGGLIGGIIGGVVGGVAGASVVGSLRTPNTKEIVEFEAEHNTEIGNEIINNCLEILKSKEEDSLEAINTQKKKLLLAHHPDKNRDKSEAIQEACRLECIKVLQAYELVKQHRRIEDENEVKR